MIRRISLSLCLAFVLVACAPSPPPTPTATPLTPVSVQLSWIHEYSASPFHAAVKEGFFTAQGIDATLLASGFTDTGYIDPAQQVLDGVVDFGIDSSSGLVESVANGEPIVAIANIIQRSPLALMTIDESIQRPQDLVGHSILVADGGARDHVESFLISQGIALDSVTLISRTDFGIEPLVNGDVDVLLGWRINEGVSLEEAGLNPTFFLLSDYGIITYEFVLFTTTDMVANNPDLVQRMVNAVHLGRDFVVENPLKAIDDTMTFAPDLDKAAQIRRLEATIPLIETAGVTTDIGMDLAVWQFAYERLVARGVLQPGFDVSSVFTNKFVEASPDL